MKKIYTLALATLALLASCKPKTNAPEAEKSTQKIGVLLVNHGSHSPTWRNALLDLEKNVTPEILKNPAVQDIKTAFMEYTEPSIATQLKAFDAEGFTDIIMVPIFLTVSPHSFDDIPTIIGAKEDPYSLEMLKMEKIQRYTPTAKVHLMPLLDFTDILEKNVLRRVKALSQDPKNEGVTLVGYGDTDYEKQWVELFSNVGEYLKQNLGIEQVNHAWCGHIAHYKSEPTTQAINEILQSKQRDIVIPVLVATDENFQIRIIGTGVEKANHSAQRVAYKPDAILPDPNVAQWVIDVVSQQVQKLTQPQ